MSQQKDHERGRRRIDYAEAKRLAAQRKKPDDPGFEWGGLTLPSSAKNENFLYLGGMGSGKTVAMFALMEQMLRNQKTRAVIHDFKMNIYPFLLKLGIDKSRIKMMNPYDLRSIGWDIQKDMTDKDVATDIAYAFVPPNPKAGSGKFFDDAAREVVKAAFLYFFYLSLEREEKNEERGGQGKEELPPIRWTLRDVLNLLRADKEVMKAAFGQFDETRQVTEYLDRPNNEVITTMLNHTRQFESIAARWDGKELQSLKDLRDSEEGKIVILGFDGERGETLQALNRLMLNRMIELVTTQTNPHPPETWFFLDEFGQIGRIPKFASRIATLREYNGCVVVATQSIGQIQDDEKGYGEKAASIITQELKNKWFGKCSEENSEWASLAIGDAEVYEESEGEQLQAGKLSTSTQRGRKTKRLVMPTELSSLHKASKEGGSEAFHITELISEAVYFHRLLPKHLPQVVTEPPIRDYQRDERRRAGDLRPMTHEERERFRLTMEQVSEQEQSRENRRDDDDDDFIPTVKRGRR